MAYCIYCGKPVEDDSRFCEHCGKPLFDDSSMEEFYPKTDTTDEWEEPGSLGNAGGSRDEDGSAGGAYGTPDSGGSGPGGDKKKKWLPAVIIVILAVLIAAALLVMKQKELLFFAPETEADETADSSADAGEDASADTQEEEQAETLSLAVSKITLEKTGDTGQITLGNENISPDEVKWASGDESIAAVDDEGTVTYVSAGETTVTAEYGTQRAKCTIVCEEEETAVHTYSLVVKDVTWDEAASACEKAGGYLVNINSEEEFDAIIEEIEDAGLEDKIFFLGASRTDSESYYWVDADGDLTGDPLNDNTDAWCNDVWLEGEPSFADGDTEETVVTMFYSSSEDRWVFNDVPTDILEAVSYYSGKIGYICETE